MLRTALAGLALVALACGSSTKPPAPKAEPSGEGPPPARAESVTETRFGVELSDPYRWMEKPANHEELVRWMRAQGAYTRARLERIAGLAKLRGELRTLSMGSSSMGALQRRGDRLFYTHTPVGKNIGRLYVKDPGAAARVLFDPGAVGGAEHAAIDNFEASPDGKRIAVNVSRGGAEITTIEIIDVDGNTTLADKATPVWGEFPASWLPDGSGFFYTQMAKRTDPKADKMMNMTVRFHRMGSPSSEDTTVLGPGVAPGMPIAAREFPIVQVAQGTKWAFGLGVGARSEMRLSVAKIADLGKSPVPWKMIAEYTDLLTWYTVHGDHLYAVTKKGAPNGKVIRLDLNAPNLENATVVVPESARSIQSIAAAKDAVYIVELDAGTAGLRSLPYGGAVRSHAVPTGSTLRLAAADPRADEVLFGLVGWAQPFGYVKLSPGAKGFASIGLSNTSPVDLSATVVERIEVPSTGGARVPLTILRGKTSPMEGKRPTILLGYGGYGITITPFYFPALSAWIARGGVYAICNVRGGGAKGRAWHVAGKGPNKPNGIRDFVACARHLAKSGLTTASRIAGRGGSMGGVLVGRAITESPEAFGAASIGVGMLNVLRMLESNNGANQIPELGDPRTESGFKAFLAMDAYNNIVPGKQYPAVLLKVGLNDQRVPPWMTAKFGARLQASGTKAPVLIRAEDGEGHGISSTRQQVSDARADEWAFLLHRFGHPDFRATTP